MAESMIPLEAGVLPVLRINIDEPNGRRIGVVSGSSTQGTLPTGIGGAQFLLLSAGEFTDGRLIYGMQMAIGFGSNKIAVRNATYNSGAWSDWRYI